MQMNIKKTNKKTLIKTPYKYYIINNKKALRELHPNRLFYLRSELNVY